ncbi:hypothetical protein BU16DRAFT_522407 [Lophium mytilinum]|uniref:Heterokaryon incompatibility domain-containing protein n=1 Tax=Lophium mytilinum TaxID=390894 RepID=A0A6A6RCH4_9PEZI|nr:hypothetical protein BU16DRAFT_522407 [Lophium mytilinum]
MAASVSTASNDDVASLYKSLPMSPRSKCIRLLKIHPPSGLQDDGGPIKGDLFVADLEQSPSYCALSYVWGITAPDPHTIKCGAASLPVSANCHSALLHLRKKIGTCFTIWIDAICIDQTNDGDKMKQIPLMGDIYSSAQRVYIWLGEGDAATNRAMEYMAKAGFLEYFCVNGDPDGGKLAKPRALAAFVASFTSRWSLRRHPLPFTTQKRNWSWRVPLLMPIRGSSGVIHASYHDLDKLLTRLWIQRIWTYQEILLASNPIVVCGDAHLQWSRFAFSIIFLDSIRPYRVSAFSVTPTLSTSTRWKRIVSDRNRYKDLTTDSYVDGTGKEHRNKFQDYEYFVSRISLGYFVLKLLKYLLVYTSVVGLTLSTIVITVLFVLPWQVKEGEDKEKMHPLHFSSHWPIILIPMVCGLLLLASIWLFRPAKHAPFPAFLERVVFHELKKSEIHDLADVLCARQATNPKDMAFGLHSVLQQISTIDLPLPNYRSSKDEIYRQLTADVLRTTGSLQFLLAAAQRRLSGQPSWVPDWSADFRFPWGEPYLSTRRGRHATPGAEPYWELSHDAEEDSVLTVWGRQLCTINSCHAFRITDEDYQENESLIHVENLRLILVLLDSLDGLGEVIQNPLNHPSLSPEVRADVELPAYWAFLKENSKKRDASGLLFLLTSELLTKGRAGLSYQDILRTHISICNSLAHTRVQVFYTNHLDISLNSIIIFEYENNLRLPPIKRLLRRQELSPTIGICSTEAQPGDQIILVSGLSVPVIVRPHAESVRLVSPAIITPVMEGLAWGRWIDTLPQNLQRFDIS